MESVMSTQPSRAGLSSQCFDLTHATARCRYEPAEPNAQVAASRQRACCGAAPRPGVPYAPHRVPLPVSCGGWIAMLNALPADLQLVRLRKPHTTA